MNTKSGGRKVSVSWSKYYQPNPKYQMRKTIYVVTFGSKWKIKCDHCNELVTDTQAEAITAAKRHVSGLPAGTLSQIIIQGRDSNFRTEWTYGRDPFPPRG